MFQFLSSRDEQQQYTRVLDDEYTTGSSQEKSRTKSRSRTVIGHLLVLFTCFSIGVLGYFTAHFVTSHYNSPWTSQALQLESIEHTFRYNRSFSYPPSNHTNHAWREIFPQDGGFFVNDEVAPVRSTFSVFHQLHCLNGLRGGYWANQRAASNGHKLTDDDLPVDIQTSHMRHCIDLLRQSLMCQADTTLEVIDERINGVHGFRTAHSCKNWEQLKEWTSEQQRRQKVEQIE